MPWQSRTLCWMLHALIRPSTFAAVVAAAVLASPIATEACFLPQAKPAGPSNSRYGAVAAAAATKGTADRDDGEGNAQRKTTAAPNVPWITCASTKELTRAVRAYVRPGDHVAELGSALRDTSSAICERVGSPRDDGGGGGGGRATLVDVRRKYPRREDASRTTAMRREGDEVGFYEDRAEFVEIGSFAAWRGALFLRRQNQREDRRKGCCYDVLVADVGSIVGNDLDLTALSLVKEFLELNDGDADDSSSDDSNNKKCRVVIVKSASLNGWARRLVHAQRLLSGGRALSDSVRRRLRGRQSCDADDEFVPPLVVGAVGVEEYRRTIPHVVRGGDAVLEVGCHLGTSTAELDAAARRCDDGDGPDGRRRPARRGGCLGVDIGPKIVRGARARHPEVRFAVADAWRTGHLLRLGRDELPPPSVDGSSAATAAAYDVVYVDVGGLSGSDGLLEAMSLLTALGNALEPRCIVIKSLCVRRLCSSLIAFSDVWQSDRELRDRIDYEE